MEPSGAGQDETLDTALGGRVYAFQPRKGYRFSVDALLLADFAARRKIAARAVDLGCGGGVVGLCLLALGAAQKLVGVDVQETCVERATRSAARNGFSDRSLFVRSDVRDVRDRLSPARADLVVSNPPFRPHGGSRLSPDETVAVSRNEIRGTLTDFTHAAAYLLKKGGGFCVVYPAARLAYMMKALESAGLTPEILRFVHPRVDAAAEFVLLWAVKGGKTGLKALPPLVLHGEGGEKYSDEARAILEGAGLFSV